MFKHNSKQRRYIHTYVWAFIFNGIFLSCTPPDQGAGKIGSIKKWGVFVGDRVQSTPAVDSTGTIYVGSSDQHLYAFSKTGQKQWRYKSKGQVLTPAIAHDGSILFNSSQGYITALQPNGRKKWERHPRQKLSGCAPAIHKDGQVFTSGDLVLVSYMLANGAPFKLGHNLPVVKTCPVLDKNGTLYFGGSIGNNETLFAYSVKEKKQLWSQPIQSAFSPPSFDSNGNLYIGTEDAHILSFSQDGKRRWSFQAKKRSLAPSLSSGFWRPTISAKGYLVVTRANEGLYSFTLHGKKRWMIPQDIRSFTRHILISDDDYIFVGSHDQYIYAFTPERKLYYRFLTHARVLFGGTFSVDKKTFYIGSFDKHLYALHTHLQRK